MIETNYGNIILLVISLLIIIIIRIILGHTQDDNKYTKYLEDRLTKNKKQ